MKSQSANGSKSKISEPNINSWSTWVFIAIVIVLGFAITVFFIWTFDVSHCSWGNFGDFFGGILVPILTAISIYLLVKTLKAQVQSNTLVSDSDNLVQFNEMFKLLLDEYHLTIKDYKYTNEGTEYGGKEALKKYMDEMIRKSNSVSSLKERHENAINEFEKFYAENLPIASLQFRLLYRLLNLLEDSNIHDNRKYEVGKIIRSQLSEQEMFFLRYNAFSRYGTDKLKELINKYNILKHLHPLSTMEFSKYTNEISDKTEIYIINDKLYKLKQETLKLLNGKNENPEGYWNGQYKAKLEVHSNLSSYSVSICRSRNGSGSEPIDSALEELYKKELLLPFVEDFAYELFVYSIFLEKSDSVEIKGETTTDKDFEKYIVRIKSVDGSVIAIR